MDARQPCPDAALLAAFLDGTLADYERTAVVSHLSECAQCRSVALTVVEFREVQTLDEFWKGDTTAPPPHNERELTRVSRRRGQTTRAPAWVLASAAAVLAVAASLYYVFLPSPQPQPVATLADLTEGRRFTNARLSDGSAFAPVDDRPSSTATPDARLVFAVSAIRDSYDHDYAPDARHSVGVASLVVGDLDEAIASLRIAAAADPRNVRAASDLAAAYFERAARAGRPDDLPAALDAAERAVQLDPELLPAWFNRALILTALGLRVEAIDAWRDYERRDAGSAWAAEAVRRGHDVARQLRSDRQELLARLLQAPTPDLARDAVASFPAQARDLFDRILDEWTIAARDGRDAAQARYALGLLGAAFDEVQRERFYAGVAEHIDRVVSEGRAASLAAVLSRYRQARTIPGDRALPLLKQTRNDLKGLDSPLALRVQLEIATTDYTARRYARALEPLQATLADARARGYRVIATRSLWIGGMAHFGLQDLAAARLAYEEMLASAASPSDVDQLVSANVLLASVHYVLGNTSVAWKHLIAAMSRVHECEAEGIKANVWLVPAAQAAAAGRYAAALWFESRALSLTRMSAAVASQMRIQHAATLRRLGDIEGARHEMLEARTLLPSIGDADTTARREADLLAIESAIAQPGNPDEALRLAQRAVLTARSAADAFQVARLHARTADAALAGGHLDTADAAVSRAIASLDAVRGGVASEAASADERAVFAKAAQIALRRGDVSAAFAYVERERLRRLYERRVDRVEVASLRDVQRRLDDGTAVAVLSQIDDQLHVWAITRDDVAVQTVDISDQRAATWALAQAQELSRQPDIPDISAQLFDAILRPVWRQLAKARTVVIVADGPYSQVAFAALWDRQRTRYLIEDFRLVSAPSATTFVAGLSRPAPRSADRVATIAASSSTRSDLISGITGQDVVQISASIVGDGGDSRATLVVADDPGHKYSGWISAAELSAVKDVRARLVLLQPGAADANAPATTDGVQQIARALIAAGVPTVVGGVGASPAAAVTPTWNEFHRQFASGMTAAESLRRAQLATLGASNRRAGPWATLTVFGSNH